ncbi:MAG: orotidine-5'-phosphate decarboxylase [Helicobacter sp.]|nr:orotidine-5'-phosphate decarboxylase [Helicobacter sp.]
MKLCIALNSASRSDDLVILKALASNLSQDDISQLYIKIGLQGFIRDGKDALLDVRKYLPNAKIFLDLKLYDIPNTMSEALGFCADLDVDLLTLHASAGRVALEACANAASKMQIRPLIFGVSALTSFDDAAFYEIYNDSISNSASKLASLCFRSGLDGAVCSSFESKQIKDITSPNFLTLCPGIRPFGESANDQKRVANLEFCAQNDVDFVVIGRPIYESKDPSKTTQKILDKMRQL